MRLFVSRRERWLWACAVLVVSVVYLTLGVVRDLLQPLEASRLGAVAVSVRLFSGSGFRADARHDHTAGMGGDRRWNGDSSSLWFHPHERCKAGGTDAPGHIRHHCPTNLCCAAGEICIWSESFREPRSRRNGYDCSGFD